MNYPKNLTGFTFGRLTVLNQAEKPEHLKSNKTYWLVKCECGNEKIVIRTALTCGNSTSCGCLRNEMLVKKNTTHGLSGTRFYEVWKGMRSRCQEPTNNQYHNYGGKGIEVCDSWQKFENFMNDMYDSYISFEKEHGKDSASIERIDTTKGYEPSNCKWATQLEQARNRGNNISVTINGKEYSTLTQVAEEFGLNYQTVMQRYRAGKRDTDLIVKPQSERQKSGANSTNPNKIEVEVGGTVYDSITALQKAYPYISVVSLTKRYKKGLRGEELITRPKSK